MSTSNRILLGLGLGTAVGLFFGESCAFLNVGGSIFIKLMQMAVTPYIVVSLILGIGRLTPETARLIAGRVVSLLLGTWVIAFALLAIVPLSFPSLTSPSYYSAPTEVSQKADGFIELFIPANIFHSLSEELIPGIILFCICMGAVLIDIPRKETLIQTLETLSEAIEALAAGVAKLAPIGVFAMSAGTAGTITWTQISRLQVYSLTYFVLALFSAFWILPMLICTLYEISYRQVLHACKEPLLLAFTTDCFVALPKISEKIRELMAVSAARPGGAQFTAEQSSLVGAILPVVFAFPTMAGMFELLFLQYAGWSYNSPIAGLGFVKLVALGVPAMFSETNAIPFLLRHFHLPSDAYNLYVMSGVFDSYWSFMANAMCMFTVTLLAVAWASGRLWIRSARAATFVAGTVVGGGFLLLGLHAVLTRNTRQSQDAQPELLTLSLDRPAPRSPEGAAPAASPEPNHLLEDITRRRVLRVGYSPDNIPWSYTNTRHELVGYDIAFANRLATSLNVALELVPIDTARWPDELEARRYDIAMVAFSITPERVGKVDFTVPHRHLPSVFVVRDHRKEEFSTAERIGRKRRFRLAVLRDTNRFALAAKEFPNAEIVPISAIEEFFSGEDGLADAWYTEAGKGFAYSQLHPAYDVVRVTSDASTTDAYPIPRGEASWLTYLDAFFRLQQDNGFEALNFETYVLGTHPTVSEPRWCVARDVLHWMN